MAIFTRRAGDANGVNNVDSGRGFLGNIVAGGLTKNPTAIKVLLGKSQTFDATDLATGGPVEAIIRQIAVDSTVVMYQADTDRLSVLVEATGSNATAIGTRIASLANASSTLGTGNVWANATTVTTSTGFKIA